MRLKNILLPVVAFALAGFGATYAARLSAAVVETRSVIAVREALADKGHTWATVQGDGLQIVLEGRAPNEALRFRAMAAAGEVVDSSRVIDSMSVQATADITPPSFAMEILRNDAGITLIGLLPATMDRDALTARLARIAPDTPVVDLLESADYPTPDGWSDAVAYAITALSTLPQSQISVAPGVVDITAISDSPEAKTRIETRLQNTAPSDVALTLAVSAPRPVITPFTVRFVMDAEGTRFDACAADTAEAQETIITAARDVGATGPITCTLGLGVPTRDWGDAVARGISAVQDLGGGTLTFSDADVRLVALQGTAQATFDDAVGDLTNALPDIFALDAVLPAPESDENPGPARFSATRSPEGTIQLRGRVADALMNTTAENFAQAKFGSNDVTMRTRISGDLPPGWSVRVLAAIEALSLLSNGAVIVEAEQVTVRGTTGDPQASAAISRLMIDKLGQSAAFSIDVGYAEELDPIAGLPSPEECVAQITAQTEGRKITFDPGSTVLAASALPIIDDIAEIFRRCSDLEIEVAGYTDSQGGEDMNARLSQQRANAVLTALRQRRIPVSGFVAVGYGETDPIADNDTEAGREANRRIEFHLIPDEAPIEEPTTLEEIEAPAPPPARDDSAVSE